MNSRDPASLASTSQDGERGKVRVTVHQNDRSAPLSLPPAEEVHVLAHLCFTGADCERVGALRPKVMVVDLRDEPVPDAMSILAALRQASPESRLVLLGRPGDAAMADVVAVTGAAAFLTRDVSPLAVLRAVRAAARGEYEMGPTGQRAVRDWIRKQES